MMMENDDDGKSNREYLGEWQEEVLSDLKKEKASKRNLMGTIEKHENLLRLQSSDTEVVESVLTKDCSKERDSWKIMHNSVNVLNLEYSEMARTVTSLMEKCSNLEKLHESRLKKVSHIRTRVVLIETLLFGQNIEC